MQLIKRYRESCWMVRSGPLYYMFFIVFYCGFLPYISARPGLAPFTVQYVLFLMLLALGLVVPTALKIFTTKYGKKHTIFLFISLMVPMVALYAISSVVYYHTRYYHFDPFLQVPPPDLTSDASYAKSEVLVLAIGGSTTLNARLSEADRYPHQLELMLNQTLSPNRTSVFNAGMDWYTSKHSLIDYVSNLRDAKPHIVIIMHAINDLYRSCTPLRFAGAEYEPDWSHFYGPAARGANPPSFERYFYETFLGFMREWYYVLRHREVAYDVSFYRSLPDFEANMRRLVEIIKNDGVQPVLVTQPSLFKSDMSKDERSKLWFGREFCASRADWIRVTYPSPESLGQAMGAFNQVTRRLANEYGVLLVDADSRIPKDLENFVDDVHFTSMGARALATHIASKLLASGLLQHAAEPR